MSFRSLLMVLIVALVATPGFLAAQHVHSEGCSHDQAASAAVDTAAPAAATSEAAAPKAASALQAFFPDGLLTADKQEAGIEALDGKIVGLYFSAHWCPPCRQFTPKLVEFRNANKDAFEIVFVSSDKDEASQFKYMEEAKMEWFTLKHRSEAANALNAKYDVQGIPTLIIVGPDGSTLSTDGRADVSSNPDGCLDTWKAKVTK